jgi:hypothetical protein
MYIKTILFMALTSISPLLANSMTISADTTIDKDDYATLETSGTCENNALIPSFTWTVNEHLADGVFSTEDIFYFFPSPEWTETTYHVNATMHCNGEADTTKQVKVSTLAQNCEHLTSNGTCIKYNLDAEKYNLYVKHGDKPVFTLEHLQYQGHANSIENVNFIPFSDNSYLISWRALYSEATAGNRHLYMRRLDEGEVVSSKDFLLGRESRTPYLTLLKNDNFVVQWCNDYVHNLRLYDKDGDEIHRLTHGSRNLMSYCGKKADITPLDNGGFTYHIGEYSKTFDSMGNAI